MWDTMNLYGVLFWQGIIDIVNVTDVEVNSSIGGGGGRGCSGVVVVAGDIVTVVVVVVGGGGVLDGLHHVVHFRVQIIDFTRYVFLCWGGGGGWNG